MYNIKQENNKKLFNLKSFDSLNRNIEKENIIKRRKLFPKIYWRCDKKFHQSQWENQEKRHVRKRYKNIFLFKSFKTIIVFLITFSFKNGI